jgi:hypothetical protein
MEEKIITNIAKIMELFCKFKVHEYMDMYPRDHVRTFIAEDEEAIKKEAIRYAQHMNQNYSGGTTRFIKVMTKEEAEAHVKSICDYEDKHPQPD